MTWRERIVAARERGAFTREDKDDAVPWRSCAVGEQGQLHPDVVVSLDEMRIIPMRWDATARPFPMDQQLFALGCLAEGGFARAVRENDFATAERCLDAIEDRVLELKRLKGSAA